MAAPALTQIWIYLQAGAEHPVGTRHQYGVQGTPTRRFLGQVPRNEQPCALGSAFDALVAQQTHLVVMVWQQ